VQVAQALRVQPLTSVPCERGFSLLGRVKTKIRNRFTSENLVQNMRVQANSIPLDEFDFGSAIKAFRRKKLRRPTGRVNQIPVEQLQIVGAADAVGNIDVTLSEDEY
jgi:hypothetical protein